MNDLPLPPGAAFSANPLKLLLAEEILADKTAAVLTNQTGSHLQFWDVDAAQRNG